MPSFNDGSLRDLSRNRSLAAAAFPKSFGDRIPIRQLLTNNRPLHDDQDGLHERKELDASREQYFSRLVTFFLTIRSLH
jgi:hypothetical protein